MTQHGRRSVPLLLVLGLALAFAPLAAGYGERAFNENTQVSGQFYAIWTTALLIPQRAAQSFVPAEAFLLYNVTLYVENVGTSQGDVLNVTIQTDSAGSPDGIAIAWSERMRPGTGWLDLPLAPQLTLAAGRKYWIVARNGQQLSSEGYRWFHSNADRVSGEAKTDTGTGWTASENTDLMYVTYGVRLEPKIAVGMSADRRTAAPGEAVTYTVHANNTGSRPAPSAWVNLTLAPRLLYVSDTVGAINGSRTGANAWRISQLPNGEHSFTVTVTVDLGTPGGTLLAATVHLDYTDSMGVSQPSSIASATVVVALKTKPMYLAHEPGLSPDKSDVLQAAPPNGALEDFDGDGNLGSTITNGQVANWTLAPPLARPLHLWGPTTVELFLDAPGGTPAATINVSLYDRRGLTLNLIASVQVAVTLDNNAGTFQLVSIDLGSVDHVLDPLATAELRADKVSGDDTFVGYNRTDVPSRVVATTDTYISIDEAIPVDDRGLAAVFSGKDTVHILANVSDPFGSAEISGVAIDLTDPQGVPVATAEPMTLTATDANSPSSWKRFSYTYGSPPKQGNYTFVLTATEGNGVQATRTGLFVVRYPAISLRVSQDIPTARPEGVVRYTLAFDNTGDGPATVWVNATLPGGLRYASDTAGLNGGVKVGDHNWTFVSVSSGPHSFEVVVLVDRLPPSDTLTVRFDLAYADEKGFLWPGESRVVDLAVILPPAPLSNPWILALLGAIAVGAPLAGYGVWRSRRPLIEEAFLLHRDGILIYHVSRSLGGAGSRDDDILGAMLTAVQDFVKDSFKYGENRELNKLEFGDYQVLIERGAHIFLAVVLSGRNGEAEIRRKVRRAIDDVEGRFGPMLAEWSGYMDELLGVRDVVRRLVGRR